MYYHIVYFLVRNHLQFIDNVLSTANPRSI